MLRKNEDGVPVELHFFPAAWSKNTAVALYGLAMRSPARPEDDEAELAELDLSEFSRRSWPSICASRTSWAWRRRERSSRTHNLSAKGARSRKFQLSLA